MLRPVRGRLRPRSGAAGRGRSHDPNALEGPDRILMVIGIQPEQESETLGCFRAVTSSHQSQAVRSYYAGEEARGPVTNPVRCR